MFVILNLSATSWTLGTWRATSLLHLWYVILTKANQCEDAHPVNEFWIMTNSDIRNFEKIDFRAGSTSCAIFRTGLRGATYVGLLYLEKYHVSDPWVLEHVKLIKIWNSLKGLVWSILLFPRCWAITHCHITAGTNNQVHPRAEKQSL